MSDPQSIYNRYLIKFGYPPKQTDHLIAYAKKCGTKLKFSDARRVMSKNFQINSPKSPKSSKSPKSPSNADSSYSNDNQKRVIISAISRQQTAPIRTGRGRSRSDADSLVKSDRNSRTRQRSMTNSLQRPKSGRSSVRGKKGHEPQKSIDDMDIMDMKIDDTLLSNPGGSGSSKRGSIKPIKTTSMSLTKALVRKCNLDLDKSYDIDKKEINDSFKMFRKAINNQEKKLLHELQDVYDKKKVFLQQKENELQRNKQQQNTKKQKMSFNPNISLILDKEASLKQIEGFGYVEYYDDEVNDSNNNTNKRLLKSKAQKKILAKLQNDTMFKLNAIIKMEEELRRKQSESIRLRQEVEDDLKRIELEQEIITSRVEEAKPLIEKARLAVSQIKKEELHEIKALKSPPQIIEFAMTAVAIILGNDIKTWRDVQKILSYRFKPNVLNFDGRNIIRSHREKVEREYLQKEEFNYDRVNEGSKVCGCMVLWVNSQVNYSKALDEVVIMEEEVRKLKKGTKQKLKLAKQYDQIVKNLQISIEEYEDECQQMIGNIIKSTQKELKKHETKLNPINSKFFDMLNIC